MNTYKRHRFPPDVISYAVWLYYRFNLSHRDIDDLLTEWASQALVLVSVSLWVTSLWNRGGNALSQVSPEGGTLEQGG